MTMLKRKLLIIVILVLGIGNIYPQQVTLNVIRPGSLKDIIDDSTEYKMSDITDLKLTGTINGFDVSWIRFMAGCPGRGYANKLQHLDLSQARIIKGWSYRTNGYYASDEVATKNDTITRSMFEKARYLSEIILPDSTKYIDENAFFGCNLRKISIPEGVLGIGFCAFSCCRGFYGEELPNSICFIDKWAFDNCYQLSSISIPNAVDIIRERTFNDCRILKQVTLGKGIKIIEKEAFGNCVKLRTLIIFAEEPPVIAPKAFYGVDISKITVFVPKDKIKVYQISPYWGDFKIKEIK